jgi:hypothetical protein
MSPTKAGVAQLVEQLIRNQQVIGSSPIAGSRILNISTPRMVRRQLESVVDSRSDSQTQQAEQPDRPETKNIQGSAFKRRAGTWLVIPHGDEARFSVIRQYKMLQHVATNQSVEEFRL